MNYALEREKDAVAFGIGLLLDMDVAVNHGDDAVAELRITGTP